MDFHCAFSHPKLPRDYFVREALRDKAHDLRFPPRECLTADGVRCPILFRVLHNTLLVELVIPPVLSRMRLGLVAHFVAKVRRATINDDFY
jgi:hypothetical protein